MSLPLAEFRANGGLLLTERCGYTAEHGNLLDLFASLSKESCHVHHTKQLPLQEMYYSSQKKDAKKTQYGRSPSSGFSLERPLPTQPLLGMCFFSQEVLYNSVAHEPEVGD